MNEIFSHAMPAAKSDDPITITPTEAFVLPGTATSTIDEVVTKSHLKTTGPDSVHVVADGPRTALTADLIAGVYPAPGSETSPDEFIPHIALTRRTLPWERRGPQGGIQPWLALIVVSDADLANVPGRRALGQSVSVQRKAVSAINGPTETHLTATLGIPADTLVDTLTLPNAVWTAIRPRMAELPLLTHVKRLTVDGVEVDHSIVMANRMPNAAASEGERAPLHLAALVSVEQWSTLFGLLPTDASTTLLVLHHWTFRPSRRRRLRAGHQVDRATARTGECSGSATCRRPSWRREQAPLSAGFQGLLDENGQFLTPLEHDQDVKPPPIADPCVRSAPQSRSSKFAIAAAPDEFDDPRQARRSTSRTPPRSNWDGCSPSPTRPSSRTSARSGRPRRTPSSPTTAVNDLPDALQKPDWVVNPAWTEQPWENIGGQSLVKDETQLLDGALADPSGIGDQVGAWDLADIVQSVTQIGAVVAAPITAINVGAINAETLDVDFADVAAAAEE